VCVVRNVCIVQCSPTLQFVPFEMSSLLTSNDLASDEAGPSSSSHEHVFEVIFQGFLQKKSPRGFLGKHMWQNRYFVLGKDSLSYYHDKPEWAAQKPPLGVIRCDMIREILVPEESSHAGLRFDVVAVGGRMFELMAPSERSCINWVKTLRTLLSQRRSSVVEALKHVSDDQVAEEFWSEQIATLCAVN
jgi:hypothetical protein